MSAEASRLATLYQEHELRLLRFVYGVVRDRAAAEDIVQSTFAKAVESDASIAPTALKSWLYRVAFNEAISWKRRVEVDRKATSRLGMMQAECRGDQSGEPLVTAETVELVRRALQSLSVQQRQVIQARIYEDKKFIEIAAELQAPLPTVITWMRRALERLRGKLDQEE